LGEKLITNIWVDGFRTLSNFKLELREGLNVLVGPNGSGKSTILQFFSFIHNIHQHNLSKAISSVGGAGAVFKKIGQRDYQRTIKAKIIGKINLDDQELLRQQSEENKNIYGRHLYYQYEFEIVLSDDREDIYFSQQNFLIRRSKIEFKDPSKISKWDLHFSRGLNSDREIESKIEYLIDDFSNRFDTSNFQGNSKITERGIDQFVEIDESLMQATRIIGGFLRTYINQEFGKGTFYNPQPDIIRLKEDSTKLPGIRADGSGLYASLLAFKRKQPSKTRYRAVPLSEIPFRRTISLSKLTEYFKLAFPSLFNIDVNNDPFDNQIRVRVTLDSKEGTQLPLAALSDGTLKWMSLITAIFTARQIVGIEEPENFIHPAVQRQALELIRDSAKPNTFVLISSHSQSIIDSCKPEELVLVTVNNSETAAKRIDNPEKMRSMISESGFGLSFFYVSGALNNG
jgi:predicted ATPase